MTAYFIGIDPGKTGAIVSLDADGQLVGKWPTPMVGKAYNVPKMREALAPFLCATQASVCIEHQQPFPAQSRAGKTGQISHRAMFAQGHGYGLWEGIVAGLGLPYHLIPPKEWQRGIRLPAKCSYAERKQHLALEAQRRWPGLPKRYADAALIADQFRKANIQKGV